MIQAFVKIAYRLFYKNLYHAFAGRNVRTNAELTGKGNDTGIRQQADAGASVIRLFLRGSGEERPRRMGKPAAEFLSGYFELYCIILTFIGMILQKTKIYCKKFCDFVYLN